MRYRWMENLVGNVWHFLPDITFFNRQMYICSDMMNYRFACYDFRMEAWEMSFPASTILPSRSGSSPVSP